MQVKQAFGKIFGMDLTAAEKKGMDIELKKQLAEYDRKHSNEIDAIILWQLHEQLGWGPKRLKRFYDSFGLRINTLLKMYEMEEGDRVWLCTRLLKEYGIDLDKWVKERDD